LVAVAFFLPGRAKDLSAPGYKLLFALGPKTDILARIVVILPRECIHK